MPADRTALQLLTLAAAQTMPRVVLAKATHGPDAECLEQLRQARHHLTELQERLALVDAQVRLSGQLQRAS